MENYEKEHIWEFSLRDNPLTKDNKEDCVAEVKTGAKTLRSEDIAKEIKYNGSELEYETILSVVAQSNRIILRNLLNGQSVMTDLCQFIPRIIGAFANVKAQFDAKIHKLAFDIILTKAVRDELKKVKVVNLGAKADVAGIDLVTDTLTDLFDGSITPNDDIRIEGNRIKIAGDPADEVGIFFVSASDPSKVFKVERKLTQNDPSTLIARVPNLADGEYRLRIVTRFSFGQQLLKEPRTLEYKTLLTVGAPSGDDDDDRPVIE